ncbi:PAS domain-containing sensor histidine kinase [Qipengyuania spongiae]|uniref:histidine kinase n=1 Tax=Qipengyuania spongiae TaxID=2909673 RepID=A0ABY5SZ75_9SPHN|nr:PAS domain-containing protein [Qipengyuania spongiae]UVI39161.1 PAS domain-containing protein [Qipengyuania spongiae]
MPTTDPNCWPYVQSAMAKQILAHDWEATPLGAIETWSSDLKTAVANTVGSAFPSALIWGPDFVTIYNDGFVQILGQKPSPLGLSFREIWSEAWDEIGPIVERAFAGRATFIEDFPLVVHRAGEDEQAYFTFAYSPVRNAAGEVLGFVDTVYETTEKVLGQQRLVISEERLRSVLDSMGGGFAILDRDFTLLDIDEETIRLDGRLRSEVVGRSYWDLFPGTKHSELDDLLRQTAIERRPGRLDFYYAWPGGKDRWLEARTYPVPEGVAMFWRDVSERRRAEYEVRELAERLSQFGEASQDLLWIRDAETLQWTYLTSAFETIYGLSRSEALSGDNYRSWMDLIVPEDRARVRDYVQQLRAGEHLTFEYRIRRPSDGEVRWLRNTDFPIEDASGRVTLIGGIGEDVTEERAAQQRLADSEERLRTAIEVGRLGLWDWDILEEKVHWSDEHFRMEGYAVGEIEPSYEAWARRLHPDDRERAENTLRRAMAEHEPFVCEFRVAHPDGSIHWLSARGEFAYDHEGRPTRMIGAMIETTQARRLEERQRLLLAELQHRVRNLIAMIQALVKSTSTGYDTVAEYVDHLVGRLQALGRTQVVLTLRPGSRADLEDLVRDELLAHEATDREVGISGPPTFLSPKAAEIVTLALHELTTNSIKYGALGSGGELSIAWSKWDQDQQHWTTLTWEERVKGPIHVGRRGFGAELIELRVPYELNGEGKFSVDANGVLARISFPLEDIGSILEPAPEHQPT